MRRLHRRAAAWGAALLAIQGSVFAQTPEPQRQPADRASRPPIVNRLNEVLPPWLRMRGEFRERVEGAANSGFERGRDDLYWLTRVRLNATLTPSDALSFQVQAQDARVARKTIGATGAPFSAPLDVRVAFADIGPAAGPLTVRVGRQELAYGEQRLVGHVSWVNAGRTFDGAKVALRANAVRLEAFATSVVRILDDEFDKSGNGNLFAGTYVTATKLIPRASIEPYAFFRRDANLRTETAAVGDMAQTTIGLRLAGGLPARLEYAVEIALQRGGVGTDTIDAWAGHWRMRQTVPGTMAARITGEYNYASGDDNPTDGVRRTFDQLYPTPHDKYGLADQIGWKNVHHLRAGVELAPVRTLPLVVNYHSWWLAERRDAIYLASSAPLARVAGGAASAHVGQELDIQATRAVTPQLQLAAGYARIFTGGFLKQATPGASYSHPYVMATYVFLAEK